MHSEYKFPRSYILVMLLTLVTVIMAIESARKISAGGSAPLTVVGIIQLVIACFAAMGLAGVLGYGVLRFFRRS